MPTLQIGRKEIPYELKRSATATERRITVTPGHVEVVALTRDNDHDIAGFLNRKRQWVFNTVRDMERVTEARHAVPRFITGSKIPYRGRHMSLTVRRTDGERAEVTYRRGFTVDLPHWAGQNADQLVASELRHWLKQRIRRDVQTIARDYEKRSSLAPASIRATDLVGAWGSCGREGNVSVNWTLVFAPLQVLRYVVAHELAHLRFRDHGREFWALVASLDPGFQANMLWLERHQSQLDATFLST